MHLSTISGNELHRGDIINCRTSTDEIDVKEILYSVNGSPQKLNKTPIPYDGNMNSTAIVCTNVKSKTDNWLQVKGPRDMSVLIPAPNEIMMYDCVNDEISMCSCDDIKTQDIFNDKADLIIYYEHEYVLQQCFIIRTSR